MRRIKRRNKSTSDEVKDVANIAKTRRVRKRKTRKKDRVEFLGSGATTLNLALSGKGKKGGWARGRIINIVGDGSSGKTLLALELAFWCWKYLKKIISTVFPRVKKLTICYDNAEGVMDFPIEQMYGKYNKRTRKWDCPFERDIDWTRSQNFEQFCRRFLRLAFALKKGEALLYIIDSWDAFQSAKSKKAFLDSIEGDKDLKGDYDLLVQKYASRKFFPAFCDALENNKIDATLLIISQVRSKIGATYGRKQTRSGGKALDFYTHQVAWIREVEKLRKTKFKRKKVYGIRSEAYIDRSKVAKPFREAEFTILYDYGIDDVNSMADFLWGKKEITFEGKKFKTRQSFVKYVEENDKENELIEKTEEVWNKVEDAFKKEVLARKQRY